MAYKSTLVADDTFGPRHNSNQYRGPSTPPPSDTSVATPLVRTVAEGDISEYAKQLARQRELSQAARR